MHETIGVCVCVHALERERDVTRNEEKYGGDEAGAKKSSGARNHSSPGVKLSFGKINPPRYAGE